MSVNEDKSQLETQAGERENDSGIWSTATTILDDDTIIELNPLEIAKDAKGMAWFAMWVSVVALAISIACIVINLSF